MFTLVIGAAASGKSQFAEQLIVQSSAKQRIYLATMQPDGPQAQQRIARHRQLRAGQGFITLERDTNLGQLTIPSNSAVLLECLSNLVANELFCPHGAAENTLQAVLQGVETLARQATDLVVVTNEVFADGCSYADSVEHYLQLLGQINCRLAVRADRVIEVVCGIPLCYKGRYA